MRFMSALATVAWQEECQEPESWNDTRTLDTGCCQDYAAIDDPDSRFLYLYKIVVDLSRPFEEAGRSELTVQLTISGYTPALCI